MGNDLRNDADLVRRMLDADERAFHEFFDEYFARLYRFALPRLNGDPDAAKDVIQATMTKAIRKLDTFRGEAALFTWMCQICRHQIADYIRERRRHAGRVIMIDDNPEIRAALEAIPAPEEQRPDQRYRDDEVRTLIRSVLDHLPARYGDALEWKYVEGLSVEQIGVRLGLGHTAAQSLLARARLAFRDAVEGVFGAAPGDIAPQLRQIWGKP